MILFTHPHGASQSKGYTLAQSGKIESLSIKRSTWWYAKDLIIDSLEDLCLQVKSLENNAASFITLGEMTPTARTRASKGLLVRRTGGEARSTSAHSR